MPYLFLALAKRAGVIACVAVWARSFGVATINLALFGLCTIMMGVVQ